MRRATQLPANLPALRFQFVGRSEDLLHGSGNNASGLVEVAPLHGVRFTTSRLAVGKTADVVAVQSRLHQQGDLLENLRAKWK